jgi:hypothetical protein
MMVNCLLRSERTEVRMGGREVSIVQRSWVAGAKPARLRGLMVATGVAVVRDVAVEERGQAKGLLEGLSYLLSFAAGSQVAVYGWSHPGDPPLSEHRAVVARAGFSTPAFGLDDAGAYRAFLEAAWPGYQRLVEARKLREAIDLAVVPDTCALPLELRLAAVFMLLENLKATHAEQEGYPFERGYFRKEPGGRGRWGFEELLADMFGKVGMDSPELGSIVDLRNDILHSAVSRTPYERQETIHDECQDLAREYLLRLLGYRGCFRLYSGRGMTTKEI